MRSFFRYSKYSTDALIITSWILRRCGMSVSLSSSLKRRSKSRNSGHSMMLIDSKSKMMSHVWFTRGSVLTWSSVTMNRMRAARKDSRLNAGRGRSTTGLRLDSANAARASLSFGSIMGQLFFSHTSRYSSLWLASR